MDFGPNTKNIKTTLFAVIATNQNVLLSNIVNHTKFTSVKRLLTNSFNDIIKETTFCSKIIETEFNKSLL